MRVDINISLAALDSTDMDQIREWRNNHAIWRWTRQSDLISDVEQRDWFERQAKDPTIKMYKIVLRSNEVTETVGVCGLTSIDWRNSRAEFSLYTRPDRQRKGYGRQALSILLAHAFENLGLRQVWGETFDGNPALALFVQLGMSQDGTRRRFYFKEGRFVDAHLVSILAEEWYDLRNPKPASPNSPDARRLTADDFESAAAPRKRGRPKKVAAAERAAEDRRDGRPSPEAAGQSPD